MEIDDLPAGVTKQTTRHPPSRKFLPPYEGDKVEVRFTFSFAGRQLHSTGAETTKFKVGEASVHAVDMAVQHMYKGEHADFTLPTSMLDAEDICIEGPVSTAKLEVELVACPLREDLFEDGAAVKTILKTSEGRCPRTGDECQVTYRISGEGVAPMTGDSAVYKIGAQPMGQLAKVLDKALLSMKLKEEVHVTCRGDYVRDSKAKDIQISLVLEEIYQVHDVSLGKLDGTVLRKRLKELNGEDRVHDTGRVRLRVLTVTSNGEKVAGPVELSFRAGDGEVCDALEGAVLGMKEGEEAMLRVLDPAACEGLVAEILEVPIMLHLLILSVQKVPQKWDMTFEERLDRAVARKSDASRLFQEKRMRLAAKHYEEMASFFVRPEDFKEQQGEATELRRVAHLNRAACMLQLQEMQKAKDLCDMVLKEEPEQPKALFRRAKALTALKEHQAALEDVKRLRDLEPKNLAAQKLLREVKEELRRQDRDSSETFSKMCTGLGELPERERREDQLVVAPDLDEEYAKLARETGVPLNRLKQVK